MTIKPKLITPFSLLLALSPGALSAEPPQEVDNPYLACFKKTDDTARLICYDNLIDEFRDPGTEVIDLGIPRGDVPIDDLLSNRNIRLANRKREEKRGLLESDDPNYFVYASPYDDDEQGDVSHMEMYLSVKYPLVEDWYQKKRDELKERDGVLSGIRGLIPHRTFFHYNGLYDFYAWDDGQSNNPDIDDPYESSPLISKRQNPGVSSEWDFNHGDMTLRLGWFHESNGQQLSPDRNEEGGLEKAIAEFELLSENKTEEFALSELSRGWDYAVARLRHTPDIDFLTDGQLVYDVEARWFCDCQGLGVASGSKEDEIWWEENNDDEISDYDGLRGMLEWTYPFRDSDNKTFTTRVELKSGLYDSPLDHVTGKFTIGYQARNVRLTAFYFDGYGRDPSTYHLRTKYFGAGLELR